MLQQYSVNGVPLVGKLSQIHIEREMLADNMEDNGCFYGDTIINPRPAPFLPLQPPL